MRDLMSPAQPICVINAHREHALGHQGRCGRRAMQDSDSLLEQTVLRILSESRFWPARYWWEIMRDLVLDVDPFSSSLRIGSIPWGTRDIMEGKGSR